MKIRFILTGTNHEEKYNRKKRSGAGSGIASLQ